MVSAKLEPQAETDLKVMAADIDMTQADFIEAMLNYVDETWDDFVAFVGEDEDEDEVEE